LPKLRVALQQLLSGWRNDLSPEWAAAFSAIEPDFAAVDPSLTLTNGEVIFPGRKGQAPPGARSDSHIFRALEGIKPEEVRVVVMGQDPYTHVSQATGRSFEQGDLADWLGAPAVTPSLRRIIQALAFHRTTDREYLAGADGWTSLVQAVRQHQLNIEPAKALWDGWQSQGVVFINAILTFNRFTPDFQFRGHQPLWKPIIRRFLEVLVRRQNAQLVCVAWGGKASQAIKGAGVEVAAKTAGTWQTSVTIVKGPHPNAPPRDAPPFLATGDRFADINVALKSLSGTEVRW